MNFQVSLDALLQTAYCHVAYVEKEMATYSSVLAGEIPWTEEPGTLHSMGSQRVGRDLATKQQ